jgi:hypothetical protein
MMADTREELLAMADRIGRDRKHIKAAGKWKEHFDVSLSKRWIAVANGAREVSQGDLERRFRDRNKETA